MEWVFGVFGAAIGALGYWLFQQQKIGNFQKIGAQIVERAEFDAELSRKNSELAYEKWEWDRKQAIESEFQETRRKLKEKEEKLTQQTQLLEKKLSDLTKEAQKLRSSEQAIESAQKSIEQKTQLIDSELSRISQLSSEEAKSLYLEKITKTTQEDAAKITERAQEEANIAANEAAATIIATAINRLSIPTVAEVTATTLSLPNDEMKRRVIGRDGRNIRTLEHLTGATILIEDSPGTIVISSFDPKRRQVAKEALSELIADGRIHPTRIEEAVEKAEQSLNSSIIKYGEKAAAKLGITDLHQELLFLVGQLKFRHSFGQNVLDHSLEVATLMGMMAEELHLNVAMAKRIGLLHDIGKVAPEDYSGSHALVGRDLAIKYGETQEVANGIGCHHEEIPPATPEGWLCCAADRLSASRPGARVESVTEYLKRIEQLEKIAKEFPEVENAFALQAGREVRIAVLPDKITDEQLVNLTREVAKKIEKTLKFPGKIKVTAIREKRAVAYAI